MKVTAMYVNDPRDRKAEENGGARERHIQNERHMKMSKAAKKESITISHLFLHGSCGNIQPTIVMKTISSAALSLTLFKRLLLKHSSYFTCLMAPGKPHLPNYLSLTFFTVHRVPSFPLENGY